MGQDGGVVSTETPICPSGDGWLPPPPGRAKPPSPSGPAVPPRGWHFNPARRPRSASPKSSRVWPLARGTGPRNVARGFPDSRVPSGGGILTVPFSEKSWLLTGAAFTVASDLMASLQAVMGWARHGEFGENTSVSGYYFSPLVKHEQEYFRAGREGI